MQTECNTDPFGFQPLDKREIRGVFDGGAITSDAGALLLREVEAKRGIIRYKKITADLGRMESLLTDFFIEAHPTPPQRIILDFDATDDPIHGDQLGRFFQGYYKEYCYRPLYVFCGDHLRFAQRDASNRSCQHLV